MSLVGSFVGGVIDAAAPASDPRYVVTYRDGARGLFIGEGPTTGGLAGQAALFAPPVLSGASRPAGTLTLRAAPEPRTIAPIKVLLGDAPFDAAYRARLGVASTDDYRNTFFSAYPELEGNVVVHHAVEQQALTRFPNVVANTEIHSLENLRGIPKEINSSVHLRQIRREWDRFYVENPVPTKQELLQKATQIDFVYGKQFNPPVGRISQ